MNYWEQAALQREIAIQEGSTYTVEEILKLYDEALEDIEREIRTIKRNFQKRFGIDDETAEYFLTEAQKEENLRSLIYALEYAPNERARQAILDYIQRDGLSVRAYAARTERYVAVEGAIYARIKRLAADETARLTGRLETAYQEGYYGMLDDTAKGLDVGLNFSMLNDRAIEEAVGAKWHGKRFSERIWSNTDRLAQAAQTIVVRSLMTGASEAKTARELAEEFEVEKYHATTLVRTETAHIHAMADKRAYEDLGIPEYKYLATLDYRTCHICGALDGMVFKVSEIREGENYPSMHPRCRCTTTMNMQYTGRSARNVFTGKSETIDGSVTYKEWRGKMSDEEKAAFELAQKKNSRKTADKARYAQYKSVLGSDNVPKTLDEFQNVMYNGGEEAERLKELYRNTSWQVKSLENLTKGSVHRVAYEGTPNSVFDNIGDDGKVISRRYYGRTGKPRLDIDLTDHNNPKQHKVVPHYHDWKELQSGKMERSKGSDKPLELWHKIANKDILE